MLQTILYKARDSQGTKKREMVIHHLTLFCALLVSGALSRNRHRAIEFFELLN